MTKKRRTCPHPTITPKRALALLIELEREGEHPRPYTLGNVRDALRQHVEAGLWKAKRRFRK